MRFTKDESQLFIGAHYLLKVPGYSESGYTVAVYKGSEADGPLFQDESWGHDISNSVIEGWLDPDFLNVA